MGLDLLRNPSENLWLACICLWGYSVFLDLPESSFPFSLGCKCPLFFSGLNCYPISAIEFHSPPPFRCLCSMVIILGIDMSYSKCIASLTVVSLLSQWVSHLTQSIYLPNKSPISNTPYGCFLSVKEYCE